MQVVDLVCFEVGCEVVTLVKLDDGREVLVVKGTVEDGYTGMLCSDVQFLKQKSVADV